MYVSIVQIGSFFSIIPFSIVLDWLFWSLKYINISSDLARSIFWNNPNDLSDLFRSIFSLIGLQFFLWFLYVSVNMEFSWGQLEGFWVSNSSVMASWASDSSYEFFWVSVSGYPVVILLGINPTACSYICSAWFW